MNLIDKKSNIKTYVCLLIWVLFFTPFLRAYSYPKRGVGHHAIVISAQHLATDAGMYILKQGGNAIDAAVAVGYALAVVHPCCGNLGGGGFMLIHLAKGEDVFLNFREKAPAKINASILEREAYHPYSFVGVPGTVMGLNTALKKYGTLPLSYVIKPAINYAERGYLLSPGDVAWLKVGGEELKKQPKARQIFFKKNGQPKVGERVVQENLASTLKLIARKGERAFYQGAIAEELVKASQKAGGVLTKQDLANYQVSFEQPVRCHYRGYPVIATPPPSSGGLALCELLAVLERFPLHRQGFLSPKSLTDNIEAIRYVYYDKERYGADPNRYNVPIQRLLSKQHITEIFKKIKKSRIEDFPEYSNLPNDSFNTTSYIVADDQGNIVAVTYSLNDAFGAKVMPGNTGFFLNDQLKDFIYGAKDKAYKKQWGENRNAPKGGAYPVSSITQTILFSHHKPMLVLATPGGSTIPTQLLGVIEGVFDYGLTLNQAVSAPRFHFNGLKNKVYLEPETLSEAERTTLEKKGYRIQIGSDMKLPYWGGVAALRINLKTGEKEGVMDKRRPAGSVQAY